MKRLFLCGLSVLLMSSPLMAAAMHSSDEEAIRQAEQTVADGIRTMDVAKIMKGYIPDDSLLVFDMQTPREFVGAKALKADWEEFLKNKARSIDRFEITDLKIYVSKSGDLAATHEIQEAEFTTQDGKKGAANTRVTHVFRKINGKWLIVHEHGSFPIDWKTGQPDLLSKK